MIFFFSFLFCEKTFSDCHSNIVSLTYRVIMAGGKAGKKQQKSKKIGEKKPMTRRQKMAEKEAQLLAEAEKEANKQNEKVEKIKILEAKFNMTKIDALLAYEKFHKKHPDGEIKKKDFLEENKVEHIIKLCRHLHLYSHM